MSSAFVHVAVLAMEPDADERAPGAAVTAELCGHWDHEPPCPLAPHHTSARRNGDDVHVRTLFAVGPELEGPVRRRIDAALAGGYLEGPGGVVTCWQLRSSGPGAVRTEEVEHALRLTQG